MAEIIFLGTSGYIPTPERDNAAFLLRAGTTSVLVDCPGAVLRKLAAAKVDPLRVGNIFVTHVHADHVYGLPSLVQGLMLRDHVFRLFGSGESVDLCKRLLDVFGLREPKYRTRVEFVALVPGERAQVAEGVEVTAWAVPHHGSSLAYEFQILHDGRRAVFSGDTAVHPPLFEWVRGADVLIHDCGAPARFFERYPALKAVHTSAADLGAWSERAGVRLLAPVHFLAELPFEMSELEAEVRTGYAGRLVLPSDMETLEIT